MTTIIETFCKIYRKFVFDLIYVQVAGGIDKQTQEMMRDRQQEYNAHLASTKQTSTNGQHG
jgi:hypothetical protein